MRHLFVSFATIAGLAGCMNSGAAASAELSAAFIFSAYPGATLLVEQIQPGSQGPFPGPGNNGTRDYETLDPPDKVRAYYLSVGNRNGWVAFVSPEYVAEGRLRDAVHLERDRFNLTIHVDTDRAALGGQGSYSGPPPYPVKVPIPEPVSSPTASPAPSVAPTTAAATAPAGPTYIRIEGWVRN